MFEDSQQLFNVLTLTLMFIGLASVVVFRVGLPSFPKWLPAFLFVAAMISIAICSIVTLFYDYGASIIQGVTLVGMTICVTFESKSNAYGRA